MFKEKIRVGIVGCGGFGKLHISNLMTMDDVQVVALYNRGEENLKEALDLAHEARGYQDINTFFSKEHNLDAVIISVIPNAHGEIESLCIKHNIPFYVEKPLGLDIDEVNKIKDKVKESKLLTSVGYQERYCPQLINLKANLDVDTVCLAQGRWISPMPTAKWWRLEDMSGGQVVEQTTHIFDVFRYLFGEPISISATAKNDLHKEDSSITVNDSSVSIVKFSSGVIATIVSSCYPEKIADVGFEIFTRDKKITCKWGESLSFSDVDGIKTESFTTEQHYLSLKTFIKAVKSNDKSLILSDYEDGAKTLDFTINVQKIINSNGLY